jgi:S1-C subfamily serine protease
MRQRLILSNRLLSNRILGKQVVSGRILAAVLAAASLAACKTGGPASAVKDDEVTSTSAAAPAGTWAGRMGLSLTDTGSGCQIASIAIATFAGAIGLASGDVIQKLNDQPTNSSADFEAVANSFVNGTAGVPWDGNWTFTVARGGAQKVVQKPASYDCNPVVLAECGPLAAQ